jgi:hypothetical protein
MRLIHYYLGDKVLMRIMVEDDNKRFGIVESPLLTY